MKIKEIKKYWTAIFYKMAKGDIASYNNLKGIEIEEFWYLFEEYEKTLKLKENG